METLTWKKFFEVLALVVVFAVPVILYLMEKAGMSLTWIFVVGWLSILAAALYLMLSIPWVWAAPLPMRIWRVSLVSLSALLAVGYGAIKIWPKAGVSAEIKKEMPSPTEPFFITSTSALTTLKRTDVLPIVMAFESQPKKYTILHTNVMLHLSITNLQPVQAMVESYEVESKTQSGKWVALTRIGAWNCSAYSIVNGLKNARLTEMERFDNRLSEHWIQPRENIRGWAFFEYPRMADREVFDVIFRVKVYDLSGLKYDSGELDMRGKTSIQGGEFILRPQELDLTRATIKFFD